VFIAGKLYETFRGTPAYIKGGVMKNLGDRSRAGDQCASEETFVLSMPDKLDLDQ
jgi:hypothetical protein